MEVVLQVLSLVASSILRDERRAAARIPAPRLVNLAPCKPTAVCTEFKGLAAHQDQVSLVFQ